MYIHIEDSVNVGKVEKSVRSRMQLYLNKFEVMYRYMLAKLHSIAGTGYIYFKKRLRVSPKLEMVKYDPIGTDMLCVRFSNTRGIVRAHVLFTESKPSIPENFGMKKKDA